MAWGKTWGSDFVRSFINFKTLCGDNYALPTRL